MEYFPLLINFFLAAVLITGIIFTLMGLPGNLLILIAAFLYGWHEGFLHLTFINLAILAILWICGELMEFLAGMRGAKRQQASRWTIIAVCFGTVIGGIAGTGVVPIIGTIMGSLFGGLVLSFSVEYLCTQSSSKAWQVAKGVIKGQMWGMAFKGILAVVMSVFIIYEIWF